MAWRRWKRRSSVNKMKRFSALLLCLLILGGCAPQAANTQECVAVLFSSYADMWQQAGGRVDITVGESVERGFVPEGTPLVDAGAGKSINVELLLSYKPTLVIYSTDIPAQAEAAELLKKSGIEVRGYHVESYEDYRAAMLDMAKGSEKTEQTLSAIDARIDAAKSSRKDKESPKILFVRAGSSASSTKAKLPKDHFACAMLEELGCTNVAQKAPVLLDGLSIEAILKEQPEHIFFSMMGDETAARQNIDKILKSEPWQALSAVQEGRVHILPKELFHFKPNGRWGESYEYLADILNGENL